MEVNQVKNKVLLISVVLVLVAGLVLASCAPAAEGPAPAGPAPAAEQEVFEWKFAGAYPWTEPGMQTMKKYICDEVEEASGGRLKITLYAAGELMAPLEVLDACGKGTIQMETSCGAYWRGKDPLWDFEWSMPYSWRDNRELFHLWDNGFEELLLPLWAENNLHCLSMRGAGHHVLYLNKPVRKVSDFKGLKLRDTGAYLDLYEDLGASTVFLAGAEIYTALQLGTVDGAGWNTAAWEDMHWNEVCEYILLPPVGTNSGGHVSVNIDAWNSLPEDLQYILEAAALKERGIDERNRIQLERSLVTKIRADDPDRLLIMPPEEVEKMRDAASRVWDKLAARSPRCAEATEVMRSYLEEHGGMAYEWPIK